MIHLLRFFIHSLRFTGSWNHSIKKYDSHIEIMNPGGLYGQARPENFPRVNDYRNSVVAEMMKNLNYVNMFNHGIGEVQDLLKKD